MRLLSIALILSLFFLSSCHFFGGERISGNGNVVSQQKEVGNFNSVRVSGAMNVHVMQETTTGVKIVTDENLMPYIDVFVDGNTLVVREKDGYNLDPSKDVVVYVTAPVFKGISVSGSGDIISDNTISGNEALEMHVSGSGNIKMDVDLPAVSSEISGSGSVALKGQATNLDISLSGSGEVRCFDLISDNVELSISGAADAEVTANKKLDIRVSGSGSVQYKGNAAVSQSISGSGDVKKVG